MLRAIPIRVVSVPSPVVIDGRPTLPAYRADLALGSVLHQGPGHIRYLPPPAVPVPSDKPTPPPTMSAHPADAIWSVADLPDPSFFPGGYYWLGDPQSQDSTLGLPLAAQRWAPNAATLAAPAWHSFFPYKPSVVATDHALFGGGSVHHPKGVSFNIHYCEHMWMDLGIDFGQPFTWVIAGAVSGQPTTHYTHTLLDAGRNPDTVGFPRQGSSIVTQPINDGLLYATSLAVNDQELQLSTGALPQLRAASGIDFRPRMFIAQFNAGHSRVGFYAPGQQRLWAGTVANTAAHKHRYYVLGRKHGVISQNAAAHMLLFEMRLYHRVLTDADLKDVYSHLSSAYQFDAYRTN